MRYRRDVCQFRGGVHGLAAVSAGPRLGRRFSRSPTRPIYMDRNYLQQAIEKNEFHPSPVVEVTVAPRLVIVLPLEIEDGQMTPIPMIIDTGALAFMYLGTGCRWALAELSCLQRGVMLKNISLQLNHSESGSTAVCLRSSSCYRNRDLSNALKLPQSLQTL